MTIGSATIIAVTRRAAGLYFGGNLPSGLVFAPGVPEVLGLGMSVVAVPAGAEELVEGSGTEGLEGAGAGGGGGGGGVLGFGREWREGFGWTLDGL